MPVRHERLPDFPKAASHATHFSHLPRCKPTDTEPVPHLRTRNDPDTIGRYRDSPQSPVLHLPTHPVPRPPHLIDTHTRTTFRVVNKPRMSVVSWQRRLEPRRQDRDMQLVPVSASRGILGAAYAVRVGRAGSESVCGLSFCHGGDGLAIAGQGEQDEGVSRSWAWETFGVSGGDVRCAAMED